MKHFVVTIITNRHGFEYKCSTISEAYNAVCDAVAVFGIDADLNKLMESLVAMNHGKLNSTKSGRLGMCVVEDED